MRDVRRSRRRAAGAAVTFAVAAVAAVVGGRVTGHLTLALVVFIGLVAVGMILTYFSEHEAPAVRTGQRSGENEGPTGDRIGGPDVRGAQGVQNGDWNVQRNVFPSDHDDDFDST